VRIATAEQRAEVGSNVARERKHPLVVGSAVYTSAYAFPHIPDHALGSVKRTYMLP
jgi:hypothetical protein